MIETSVWTQQLHANNGRLTITLDCKATESSYELTLRGSSEVLFTADPLNPPDANLYSLYPMIERDLTALGDSDISQLIFAEYKMYPLLTPEAEAVLLLRHIVNGEANARQRLVLSNIGLVIAIAQAYDTPYIPLVDLVQTGVIGLIRAIDEFSLSKAIRNHRLGKLSTYATWKIRRELQEFFAGQSHIMAVSREFSAFMGKVKDTITALAIDYIGEYVPIRIITLELLSNEVMYPIFTENDIQAEDLPKHQLLINKVEAALALLSRKSLDSPHFRGEADGPTIEDMIEIRTEPISDQVGRRELKSTLLRLINISRISKRDAQIIIMYYNLNGDTPDMSLEAIGRELGLTKAAMHVALKKSLSKLRHPKYTRVLRKYL